MTQQQIDTFQITNPPLDGIGDSVINAATAHGVASYTFSPTLVGGNKFNFSPSLAGLSEGSALYMTSTNDLPGGLTSYTKYYVVNATAIDFQVSATLAGSFIVLSSQGSGVLSIYTTLTVAVNDPWDRVLTVVDMISLNSVDIIPALDFTVGATPLNPLVTESTLTTTIEERFGFIEIGPAGGHAVFNGNDITPFTDALALLNGPGRIYVKPGVYSFSTTLVIPSDVHIIGTPDASGLGVVIISTGDFPAITLTGNRASLDLLNIQAPLAANNSALILLGQENIVTRSLIDVFAFVGIQLGGSRNKLSLCKISETAGLAVIVQGTQNTIEFCSFAGLLTQGAVRIEGSACGVFDSYFSSTLIGYSYWILANSDTRIVCNFFGSEASLLSSLDEGSKSVRYGNTPNTLQANQNNFMEPLQQYTGQPALASSVVTLDGSVLVIPLDNLIHYLPQNTFIVKAVSDIDVTTKLYIYTSQFLAGDKIYVFNNTSGTVKLFGADFGGAQIGVLLANTNYFITINNPLNPNGMLIATTLVQPPITIVLTYPFATTSTDLTDIAGDLDLLLEKSFEERNFFLESADPTYDSLGSPTSGVFSWDGTTLNYPQFFIRSVLNRSGRWVINAGSNILASGEVLYVTLDQTLAGIDIILTPTLGTYPLPLTSSDTFVLAANISGKLYWLNGFRILTAMSSFDVDGTPLPIVRYIGMSEAKNPPLPPSMFAGAANADLTVKLSAQSRQLKSLYENTNTFFEVASSDAEFSTDPTPGDWLSGLQLTTGIPSTPTHLLSLRTQAFGLVPSSGLYKYSFSAKAWTLIPGNPLAGPFTALAPLAMGIGVLQINGQIAQYDPDTLLWTSHTPTLGTAASSLLPFATARSGAFPVGGQVDYTLQTHLHSFFKTLSGDVVRYSLVNNYLELVPTIYTEDVGCSLKDTGYNSLRDPSSQFESLDNGISFTTGLPIGIKSTLLAGDDSAYGEFRSVDFSSLIIENFALDSFSGSWMAVYKNAALTKYYILGGGRDVSYLYATLSPSITAMFWVVNPVKQEVFALGATGALEFAVLHGSPGWVWDLQILGGVNSCTGCVGVMDYYPGGSNTSELWAIASDSASSPTMWKRDLAGVWTSHAFSIPNGFSYTYPGLLKAYGAASPIGVGFLVTDSTTGSRPTLYLFRRTDNTYQRIRLHDSAGSGDYTLASAVASSATQFYGACYHRASNTVYYVVRDGGTNTVLYGYHPEALNSWSASNISTSGNSLPAVITSANHIGVNNLDPIGTVPVKAFLLTNDGFSTLTIAFINGEISGVSVVTSVRPLSGFSSVEISPYVPQVGSFRGGEPSISIGTWSHNFPVQGAGLGNDPGLGGGIFWSEPGIKVKNLGDGLWAGINRGGYFWIADASYSTRQIELRPTTLIRGDITVANLGTMTDFDFALSPGKVAIVFADGGNANKIGFLLITLSTMGVVYERAGIDFVLPEIAPCASAPRMEYNPISVSHDIVVQDDSRLGGQVAFYRRYAALWIIETLGPVFGPLANKVLAPMVANAGISPSKPLVVDDVDIVASQVGATGDLLVFFRSSGPGGFWISSGPLGTDGFIAPEIAFTGGAFPVGRYWVCGNSNGSVARIAKSANYASPFTVFANPFPDAYNRVSNVKVYAYSDHIAAASPLLGVPANQEMGIFSFSDSLTSTAKSFAAMGRVQSHSGEEETNYVHHSWSSGGSLVYGATRPGRLDPHYSVRVSRTEWLYLGDSPLGSGRLNAIGDRSYREEYVDDANAPLISEFRGSEFIRTWDVLPIAQRDGDQFTCLRYPYAADAVSPLLSTGNPTDGFVPDPLNTGALPATQSRSFPLISGITRIQGGAGASVLYNGGIATLAASYLPTIGVNGMLKLNAINSLQVKGSFKIISSNDLARSYTISGPLVFNLDACAVGSHLVMQFPTSLVLDTVANPLTNWTDLNYPQTTITIVLGEVREKSFVLYPVAKMNNNLVKLTYGTLELPDISEDINSVSYCTPASQYCITKALKQNFEATPVAIDSITIKRVGGVDGIQKLEFPTPSHVLLVSGLPPNGSGFYLYRSSVSSEGRVVRIAGKYLNLVDL